LAQGSGASLRCTSRIMRARFLACVAIVLMGLAFWSSLLASRHDDQVPLVVRLLQGPHREAQFYSTAAAAPVVGRAGRAFTHFRAPAPRMDHWGSRPGTDAPLRSDRSDQGESMAWLAWLPFGLLIPLLLERPISAGADADVLPGVLPDRLEPPPTGGQAVAMVSVRGEQSQSSRSRQTLAEWICM
jgi:hypothetical protein